MGVVSHLADIGSRDIGVDLGSANTVVYVRGRGIVLTEPSLIAVDSRTGEVRAFGNDAVRVLEETPGAAGVWPLKNVASDFDLTKQMLRHLIRGIHQNRFVHPRLALCLPPGFTTAQRRAFEDACHSLGAGEARLIAAPMAAALGAGLAVREPAGSLVVDIGAAGTEIAVIALGTVVLSRSIPVGGDELDRTIADRAKQRHGLLIGARSAEEVKIAAGSAASLAEEIRAEISGRDLVSGLPKTVTIGSEEVREALRAPLERIVVGVKDTLERTPPGLAGGIMERGITLAGGGSLLQGLKQRLRDECRMPCQLAESPLTCVAVGAGISLEELEANDSTPRNSESRRRYA